MFVLLNGKFIEGGEAKISVMDNGLLYGDGVYETLRTYGGKIWQVDEHLRRLRSSATMLKIGVPWDDRKLVSWLKRLCSLNGFGESRIRITVTRGINGMDFSGSKKPTILIQAVELKSVPRSAKMGGVKVITVNFKRLLPEAKTISLLPMILARQAIDKAKVYEAVFVDEGGHVLEGTVTNVFIVKKGIVYTPGKHVLPGTTAKALIKAVSAEGIRVVRKDIGLAGFMSADEVFLTNAPRGIVPVAEINGKKVDGGKPGKLTRRLMAVFEEYICKNI
jgi:branched-chain amino acid aminotransferase